MSGTTALLFRFLRSEPLPPPTRYRVTRSGVIGALLVLLVALVMHIAYLGLVGLDRSRALDFYVFYTSTRVARLGLNPYDPGPGIDLNHKDLSEAAGAVLPRYLNVDPPFSPKLTWGFGVPYPPEGYLLFLPFSLPRWHSALWAWLTFLTLMAAACGTLVWPAPGGGLRSPLTPAVIVALMLVNPTSELMFSLGQCSLVICGAVALGQWALRRGHRVVAAAVWSFCSIKPQLGLPLIALSLPLGGWRFFRDVGLGVVLFNLVGGIVVTGNPLMILDMFESLRHYTAMYYNTPQASTTVGWNRLLYALGGPAVDLSAGKVVAGYFTACLLLFAKFLIGGRRSWAPSYWLAVCAAVPFTFALAHDYDMVILALLIPYLLELWDHRDRLMLGLLAAALAISMIPKSVMSRASLRLLAIDDPEMGLLNAHRGLAGLTILALLLLGPTVFVRGRASAVEAEDGGSPAGASH